MNWCDKLLYEVPSWCIIGMVVCDFVFNICIGIKIGSPFGLKNGDKVEVKRV